MTISYLGKATNASGATTAQPDNSVDSLAGAYAAGDLLVCPVANYPETEVPTLAGVSGWAMADSWIGGTGTAGEDAGQRRVSVFYKVATSGSETYPTATITTATGSVVTCNVQAYRRTSGTGWSIAASHGTDDTPGSGAGSYSVTTALGMDIASGDMLIGVSATNSNLSGSGGTRTIAATGSTIAALQPVDNITVSTGYNQRLDSHYALVTAGSSTGTATYTAGFATSAGSYPTGPASVVRLREITLATKRNSFMGITSPTSLAVGDHTLTGGTSGDAFDAIVLGSGATVTVSTTADVTDLYDRGIVCDVNATGTREAMVRWNVTPGCSDFHRFYFKTFAAAPTQNVRLARGYYGTTLIWELRYFGTPNHIIGFMNAVGGGTFKQVTSTLTANTIYRVEFAPRFDVAATDIRVYQGEDTTSPAALTSFTTTPLTGPWDNIRYGHASGSTAVSDDVLMGGIARSEVDWIGPATSGTTVTYGRLITIGG